MGALKVFISQPMRGKSYEEIEKERQSILKFAGEILGECREIASHFKEESVAKMLPLDCLGNSIKLMSFADVVIFAPGWEDARGCRIEHECALQYGYRIIDLSDSQYEGRLE